MASTSHQRIGPLLICLFLLASSAPLTSADEASDNTLEARGIQSSISDSDVVLVTWRNINTTDVDLLDQLHQATYDVYRKEGAINPSDLESLTPVVTGIPACVLGDNNSMCSGKQHSAQYLPSVGNDGMFHYALATNLADGSMTTTFTPGSSHTSSALHENVSNHWGPTDLEAFFDVTSKATVLTWSNPVDDDGNHLTWLWRHDEPATRANWDGLDKEAVSTIMDSRESTTTSIPEGTDRNSWYSITWDDGVTSDSRLLGGNTLTSPVHEDTNTPVLIGELTLTHNELAGMTHLDWGGSAIEAGLVANIWRSSAQIDSTLSAGVTKMATVDAQLSTFDLTLPEGVIGEFWYAVTYEDQTGNQLTTLDDTHPRAGPVKEITVSDINSTIPNDLMVNASAGSVHLTWTDVPEIEGAVYHVWRNLEGPVTAESIEGGSAELLADVPTGLVGIHLNIAPGIERQAWYGITLTATFGSSPNPYAHDLLVPERNAIESPAIEDATPPELVDDLSARYDASTDHANLDWTPVEDAQEYEVWVSQGSSLIGPWWNASSQEGWVLINTYEGGQTSYSVDIPLTAFMENQVAILVVTVDALGNADRSVNDVGPLEVVSLDRIPPELLITLEWDDRVSITKWANDSQTLDLTSSSIGSAADRHIISSYESVRSVSVREVTVEDWTPLGGDGPTWDWDPSSALGISMWNIRIVDDAGNVAIYTVSVQFESATGDDATTDSTQDDIAVQGETSYVLMGIVMVLVLISVVLMMVAVVKDAEKNLVDLEEE